MKPTIIRPRKGGEEKPHFTAFGKYERAEDLQCILVKSAPKFGFAVGEVRKPKPGYWSCTFLLDAKTHGEYVLAVRDSKRLDEPVLVRFKIVKRRFALPPPRITVDRPVSFNASDPDNTVFCLDDTASGHAPVPAGTPDPNMTCEFLDSSGVVIGTGTIDSAPSATNAFYWSAVFTGLPATVSCTFRASSDQHASPTSVNSVKIVDCSRTSKPTKPTAKKAAKKKSAKKR